MRSWSMHILLAFSLPRLVEELQGKNIIQISCGGGHTAALSGRGCLLSRKGLAS